jgi:hypothetical protein
MFGALKAAWAKLAGGGEAAEAEAPPVDYNGFRIRPNPYRQGGQYQTAGIIEHDGPEGVRQHRFIRADTHPSREVAIEFTVMKAKQIIDLQGERMFAAGP